jgi:23S rRNA pseudouridine1911/1915/1917 synthase
MNERFEIQVLPEENRMRLEDLLFDRFRNLSKLYLREIVRSEKCEVNGRIENRGHRLRPNDFIEISLDPRKQNSMVPQPIPLEIVHDDIEFAVVDKPAGMLAHPSHRDKTGTILNALAYHFNNPPKGTYIRPGLVHRLDKDTSGLLVVSKTTRAHAKLATQFEKKQVEKRYLAVVAGIVESDEGSIDLPIGRLVEKKLWTAMDGGRPSETRFRVLERGDSSTLLELVPVTGRTNQLRIHCAAIGHPILGDTPRGGPPARRLFLHSHKLSFRHPAGRETLTFESPVDFAVS